MLGSGVETRENSSVREVRTAVFVLKDWAEMSLFMASELTGENVGFDDTVPFVGVTVRICSPDFPLGHDPTGRVLLPRQ